MHFYKHLLVSCVMALALGVFLQPQTTFAAESATKGAAETETTEVAEPAVKATEVPKALANTPAKIEKRHTPVAVEYEGNDSIGAALSMRVKELLNVSSLFLLTDKDTPKIRVLIATVPEFPSRPGIGSVYSVVWLFSQSENTLRHFLQREVGVLTADEVTGLAAKILEKTDVLSAKYSYLF